MTISQTSSEHCRYSLETPDADKFYSQILETCRPFYMISPSPEEPLVLAPRLDDALHTQQQYSGQSSPVRKHA